MKTACRWEKRRLAVLIPNITARVSLRATTVVRSEIQRGSSYRNTTILNHTSHIDTQLANSIIRYHESTTVYHVQYTKHSKNLTRSSVSRRGRAAQSSNLNQGYFFPTSSQHAKHAQHAPISSIPGKNTLFIFFLAYKGSRARSTLQGRVHRSKYIGTR